MVDAWISCNNCGHRFGSFIEACPKCGAKNSKYKGKGGKIGKVKKIGIGAGIAAGAFFVLLVAVGLAYPSSHGSTQANNLVSTNSSTGPQSTNAAEAQTATESPTSRSVLLSYLPDKKDMGASWNPYSLEQRSYPAQSNTFNTTDSEHNYTEYVEQKFARQEGETSTYIIVDIFKFKPDKSTTDFAKWRYDTILKDSNAAKDYRISVAAGATCWAVSDMRHFVEGNSQVIEMLCGKGDVYYDIESRSIPYLPASVEPDVVNFAQVIADKIR